MNSTVTKLLTIAAVALPVTAFAAANDQKFVDMASQGGMTEVALSQVAVKTSQNSDVKSFAQQMVTDHSKANDALSQAASKDSLTVGTALDSKHQKMVDKLSKLSGSKFDVQYVKDMVSDHDKTVSALQKEAAKGKSPDVVAWAKDTLPTVQQHDDMAHKLSDTVK